MNFFSNRHTPMFTVDSAPSGRAPQRALLPPQTEEQKLSHFFAQLESALKSIDDAEAQSIAVKDNLTGLKNTLDDRSWWGAVKANFNGQTDKELAENVQALGQSMEVTQKVVRVMLQVQTQKGRLLNAFNEALVDKIARIQTDTHTLDGNQRATALAFLGELQQQVQEQIQLQDLIEQHDSKLQDLIQWQFEKRNEDAALAEQLEQQQASREKWQELKDLRDAHTEQQLQTFGSDSAALKQAVTDLDQWRQARHKADDELSAKMAESARQTAQHLARNSDSIATIEASQSMQDSVAKAIHARVDDLQARVTALERAQSQKKSFSALVMRHGMSLLALGVAVAALAKVLIA